MTTKPSRAAIYCRISRDPNGNELGVRRQEKDCRALAGREGFEIAAVFVDDDKSAYSGKKRPGFEQMRELVEAGAVDVIVAWHPDRLTRQPRELEDLIDLLEVSKTTAVTVQAGAVDLSTPAGRMTARVVGAVARGESEHKSARLRRKHQELAENGKLSGGGIRPFGYAEDRITLDRTEAKVVRELADRVLAGESIRGLCSDLDRRGITTPTGKTWNPHVLRSLLCRARIAGIREHSSGTFPAIWPAIISEAELRRLRTILLDPSRRTQRGETPKMLTGLLRCSKCGSGLLSQPRGDKTPTYACRKHARGCGGTRILAEPVETLVVETVLRALDSAPLGEHAPSGDDDVDRELVELDARLVELGELFATGEIPATALKAAGAKLEARRLELDERIRTEAVEKSGDHWRGGVLREAWPEMGVEQRRSVLAAVVDRIEIGPAVRGRNYFDADRVSISWKV